MGISSNKLTGLVTVAFLLVLANAGNAFAMGSWTTNNKQPPLSTAPQEEVKQFKGIVVKRDPDSFTMSETTGGPTKRLPGKHSLLLTTPTIVLMALVISIPSRRLRFISKPAVTL